MSTAFDVYLIDGTYELFRQFYGMAGPKGAGRGAPPDATSAPAPPSGASDVGAARAVTRSLVTMISQGVTHLGVATDHVIESFRNEMWPGYKSSAGMPQAILAQFQILEDAVSALGVRLWAMVDLEADDALASAAAVAARDGGVGRVFICTPDKDLAQCVVGTRVVELDRRKQLVLDEEGVKAKFGVSPGSIPDLLALVGDTADGYPGLPGWGKQSASTVLAHYGHIPAIPDHADDWDEKLRRGVRGSANLAATLRQQRDLAMLFRDIATARIDESLMSDVEELRWRGPTEGFDELCERLRDRELPARVAKLAVGR